MQPAQTLEHLVTHNKPQGQEGEKGKEGARQLLDKTIVLELQNEVNGLPPCSKLRLIDA